MAGQRIRARSNASRGGASKPSGASISAASLLAGPFWPRRPTARQKYRTRNKTTKKPNSENEAKKKNRLNRKCMAFSFPLGGWRKRGAFLTNRISRGRHVACSRHSPFAIVFSEYRSGEILRATEAEGASTPPAQYLADLVCGMPTGILRSREKIFRFNRRAADAGPARPRPKGVRLYRHFAATSKDKIKM